MPPTKFFRCFLILAVALLGPACSEKNSPKNHCGPDNCDGCCDGIGGCRPGTERAFCGTGGEACSLCSGGICRNHECVYGEICNPENCSGCCDEGGNCRAGNELQYCGVDGNSCQGCTGFCDSGECMEDAVCGPDNCNGCCDDQGTCRAGTQDHACGRQGQNCESCTTGTCEGGQCATQTTCGPGNCDGCCDTGGICRPGNQNHFCGAGGNTCLSCGSLLCEAGGCVDPPPLLRIGLWLSPWRLGDRTPAQWVAAIRGLSYASSVPSRPVAVIAICGAFSQTTTRCFFPKPSSVPGYANINYSTDRVTPLLNAIEADGTIDVILDVEPMQAKVSEVMHVAMTAFGNLSCVKGFAPDWEWVNGDSNKVSRLPEWNSELQSYKAGMEFHLISWMTNAFGTWRDDSVSYGFDGQSFTGLSQQLWYFNNWTDHFSPNRSAWYWGYNQDVSWTRPLVTNPTTLRNLQDQYSALEAEATILMATENLFFEIDSWLPVSPMWQ